MTLTPRPAIGALRTHEWPGPTPAPTGPAQPTPAPAPPAPPSPAGVRRGQGLARRQALAATVVAAAVPTVLAAQGMTTVGRDVLALPPAVAATLATFLELALLACALLARAAAVTGRHARADTTATWVLAAVSGVFSAAHEVIGDRWAGPPSVLAAGIRLSAPLVAAWLWHRVLVADRDQATGQPRTRAQTRRTAAVLDLAWATHHLTTAPTPGRARDAAASRARRRRDRAHDRLLRRHALALDPATQAELAAVLTRLGLTTAHITTTHTQTPTAATPSVATPGAGTSAAATTARTSLARLGEPVSVRAGTSAAATTARTPARATRGQAPPAGTTPSTAPVVAGLSDEQILARVAGRSPGVRALMRAYGVGQGRASRVHHAANAHPAPPSEENTSPTKDQTKKSDQESTQMMITPMNEASLPEGGTGITDQATTKAQAKANDKTHPGITDRVGGLSTSARPAGGGPGQTPDGLGEAAAGAVTVMVGGA